MVTLVDNPSQDTVIAPYMLRQRFRKLMATRFLIINFIVFVLQYTGLMLTTLCTHKSPLWFAPGTACAFIFLRGKAILPGIAAGSLCAYYFSHCGLAYAFLSASLYVIQTYLLLRISYFCLIPSLVFYRTQSLMQFIVISSVLTGLTTLAMLAGHSPIVHWQLWLQWWLADLIGTIIFAFAILTWDAYFPQTQIKQLNRTPILLLYSALFGLILLCLWSQHVMTILFATSALIVITTLISTYLGWCGAVSAIFTTGLLMGLGAYLNAPVYTAISPIYFQVCLLVNLIISFIIGVQNNRKTVNMYQM